LGETGPGNGLGIAKGHEDFDLGKNPLDRGQAGGFGEAFIPQEAGRWVAPGAVGIAGADGFSVKDR